MLAKFNYKEYGDEDKFKKIFRFFISKNADCNAKDENSMAVLHHAIMKKNLCAVLSLIECKEIDINVSSYENFDKFLNLFFNQSLIKFRLRQNSA